jgi:three-Cys-motif partner protein
MKLLIVAIYVDIYTNIAKKWFKPIVYIDMFAGPGFNYSEELDEVLAGSPLLARIMPRVLKSGEDKAFDIMLLFDSDALNCQTLNQVMPAAIITCCDSNSVDAIRIISSTMSTSRKSHFLAFIDPEGTEIKWDTLKNLFRLKGDLMINYMYSGVARLVGSYHGTKGDTKASIERKLTDFFGTDDWKEMPPGSGSAEPLFELYLSRVQNHRAKTIVIPIPSEIGGFQYRIIIAVKETKGGSPWLIPLEQVREKMEKMSYSQLKLIVDIYRKRQMTLEDY